MRSKNFVQFVFLWKMVVIISVIVKFFAMIMMIMMMMTMTTMMMMMMMFEIALVSHVPQFQLHRECFFHNYFASSLSNRQQQ